MQGGQDMRAVSWVVCSEDWAGMWSNSEWRQEGGSIPEAADDHQQRNKDTGFSSCDSGVNCWLRGVTRLSGDTATTLGKVTLILPPIRRDPWKSRLT